MNSHRWCCIKLHLVLYVLNYWICNMWLGFSQCTASLAENYNAVLKYNYIYLDYISVSVLQWMSQSESDSQGQAGSCCGITNGTTEPRKIFILMNLDTLYRFSVTTHTHRHKIIFKISKLVQKYFWTFCLYYSTGCSKCLFSKFKFWSNQNHCIL